MPASNIGLAVASAMSVTNVLKDVTAKRLLQRNELYSATFAIRVLSALGFAIALFWRGWPQGSMVHDGGPLFGLTSVHLPTSVIFAIYLSLDVLGVAMAAMLYNRALQITPISLCAPFLAFTPIFLLGTSAVFLHELPTWPKACGALLVVLGSLFMHAELFKQGFAAPAAAILRDRGTRYSLLTAFLFALTNPIDKKLVLMSSAEFQALVYGLGLCVFFGILVLVNRAPLSTVLRTSAAILLIASVFDCSALLLQFISYRYLDVLVAVSIKRAGIILAVLFGWLFFREKNIRMRLIAASTMFAGVAVMYFVHRLAVAITITAIVTLVVFAIWKFTIQGTLTPDAPAEAISR